MTTLTLSATEARNQFFPLLDRIARGEIRVVVKKMDSQVEVVMSKPQVKKTGLTEIVNKTYGFLKNVSEEDFGLDKTKSKKFLTKLRKQAW